MFGEVEPPKGDRNGRIGWPVIKSKVCVGSRCATRALHRGGRETARSKRLRDRVDCEFERRTLVTNDLPPPGSDKRR